MTTTPVLSSSTVVHRARRSSTLPFFTTIPRRAATDRPQTRATGAARMSGQGVATTRTATARGTPGPGLRFTWEASDPGVITWRNEMAAADGSWFLIEEYEMVPA
jgi:hypothetical protein